LPLYAANLKIAQFRFKSVCYDPKNQKLPEELLIMINSIDVINYLSLNKNRLKKEYNLKKIGVFGSIARNEQKETSDIDLIVEFENNTPSLFETKERLRAEIKKKFNVNVDICREKYIKQTFKEQIISEAKYL